MGYLGAEKRVDTATHSKEGKKIRYKINRRPLQSRNNSVCSQEQIKCREHEKSSVHAKFEHILGVVKGLFGYHKRDTKAYENKPQSFI